MQHNKSLSQFLPVIMLDDVQELYPDQRQHLKDELIRRTSIPRWLAMRTHVFGLEELISLEGADQGREYREIPLDEIFQERSGVFAKFAANVVHRRLQATESLQHVTVNDFKDLLRSPSDLLPADIAQKNLSVIVKRLTDLGIAQTLIGKVRALKEQSAQTDLNFTVLLDLEKNLIATERQANRGQASLFPDMEIAEATDAKTQEAAQLFATRRLRWPYYFGFDTLTNVASGNVEQLLASTAAIVDRMIFRAELDRDTAISAKEQEDILKRCADDYYGALEEKYRRGTAIRQLVDNLGHFCEEVTYRRNAPIAPGVNGFGLTQRDIVQAVSDATKTPEAQIFREVLTNAVAGNVLSVRLTKQGQAGSEKIVFYLNRLLCLTKQVFICCRFRRRLWRYIVPAA
jgi:hypothetical protein